MRKSPFTLVEVVVALGILSLILLVSSLAVSTVYRTWRSITEHEEELKQCRNIDRVVESAFRNAVPFYWRNRNNKEIMLFSGGRDSMLVSYLHRIDDREQGGIRFLRLFREGDQLVAEYRQRPFFPGEWEATPEREVIATGVSGLAFLYADHFGQRLDWFEEWDVERRKNLPIAIQMEVSFANGKRQAWLRRTAGNGQFQEWGRRLIPQQ